MREVRILAAEFLSDKTVQMAGKKGYFHRFDTHSEDVGALIEIDGCVGWYGIDEFKFIEEPEDQSRTERRLQVAATLMSGMLARYNDVDVSEVLRRADALLKATEPWDGWK